MGETSKIRDKVMPFVRGKLGLDLGCGNDRVTPLAVGVNRRNPPEEGLVSNLWLDLNNRLPCPDCSWDYVYSSHLLEHLKNPWKVLTDWWRVVKVEGHLILYLPHKRMYTQPNPEHLHAWDTEEMVRWFGKLPRCKTVLAETDNEPGKYSFLIIGKKMPG